MATAQRPAWADIAGPEEIVVLTTLHAQPTTAYTRTATLAYKDLQPYGDCGNQWDVNTATNLLQLHASNESCDNGTPKRLC